MIDIIICIIIIIVILNLLRQDGKKCVKCGS